MNRPRKTSTRRGFFAALAAVLAAGFTKESDEYKKQITQGYRHGKHNGRVLGAFGGKRTAKAHRRLYVQS